MQGCIRFKWLLFYFFFGLSGYSVLAGAAPPTPAVGTKIRAQAILTYRLANEVRIYQHIDESDEAEYGASYSVTITGNSTYISTNVGHDATSKFYFNNNSNTTVVLNAVMKEYTTGNNPIYIPVNTIRLKVKRNNQPLVDVANNTNFSLAAGESVLVFLTGNLELDPGHTTVWMGAQLTEVNGGTPFGGQTSSDLWASVVRRPTAGMSFVVNRELVSHRLPQNNEPGEIVVSTSVETKGGLDHLNWSQAKMTGPELRLIEFLPNWITHAEVYEHNLAHLTNSDWSDINWQDTSSNYHDDYDDHSRSRAKMLGVLLSGGMKSQHGTLEWKTKIKYDKSVTQFQEGTTLPTRIYSYGSNLAGNRQHILNRSDDFNVFVGAEHDFSLQGFNDGYQGNKHRIESASVGEQVIFRAKVNNGFRKDSWAVESQNSTFPTDTVFYFMVSDTHQLPGEGANWSPLSTTIDASSQVQKYIFIQARLPLRVRESKTEQQPLYSADILFSSRGKQELTKTLTVELERIEPLKVDVSYQPVVGQGEQTTDINPFPSLQQQNENTRRVSKGLEQTVSFYIYNQSAFKRSFEVNVYKGDQLEGSTRPYRSDLAAMDWHWFLTESQVGPRRDFITVDPRQGKKVYLTFTAPRHQRVGREVMTVVAGDVVGVSDALASNDALKFYLDINELSDGVYLTPPTQSAPVEIGGSVTYKYFVTNAQSETLHLMLSASAGEGWRGDITAVDYVTKTAAVVEEGNKRRIELMKGESATILLEVTADKSKLLGETDVQWLKARPVAPDGRELSDAREWVAKAVTTVMTGQLRFDKLVAKGASPDDADFQATVDNVRAGEILTWKGVLKNRSNDLVKNVVVFETVPAFTTLVGATGAATIAGTTAVEGANLKINGTGRKSLIFYLGKSKKPLTGGTLEKYEEVVYTYQIRVDD